MVGREGSNVLSCVHSKWAMVFLFLICMEGERLPERVERGGRVKRVLL